MSVIDASDMFADRRWCPLQFVKSAGRDPAIYAANGLFAPLSVLPDEQGRFLVRVLRTAWGSVPAVRFLTSVLWRSAFIFELRYDPTQVAQSGCPKPPELLEMIDGDDVLRVSFRVDTPGFTPTEAA